MASGANARHRGALSGGTGPGRRVLAIATDAVDGVGLIDELVDGRAAGEVEVAIVAAVVEHSAVRPLPALAGPVIPAS